MKSVLKNVCGLALSFFTLLAFAQEAAPEGELAPQVGGIWIVLFGLIVLGGIAWFFLLLVRNEKKRVTEAGEGK